MNRPGEGVRASGLPLPWGTRIAFAIAFFAFFVFAYVDGRPSLATLALLVLAASTQLRDARRATLKGPRSSV